MTTYNEVLAYLKGKGSVTIPELQTHFSENYLTISKIVEKLVSEELITLGTGITYSVSERLHEESARDETEGLDQLSAREALRRRRMELERLLRRQQEEHRKKDNDDDDDDDELDDDDGELEVEELDDDNHDEDDEGPDALEKRFLELKAKLDSGEITVEDDEEGDEDDEEEDDEEEDDEEGGDLAGAADCILKGLSDAAVVFEQDGKYYAKVEGLEADGAHVKLRILMKKDGVYFSNTVTLPALYRRVGKDEKKIKQKILKIAAQYGVKVVREELRIKVEEAEEAMGYILRLFAAMERIAALDAYEVNALAEIAEADLKSITLVQQFIREDPTILLSGLLSRLMQHYECVKDSCDVDAIIVAIRGVKEFMGMSDEAFLALRERILAEWRQEGEEGAQPPQAPIEETQAQTPQDPQEGEEGVVTVTYIKALALVVTMNTASISFLQRKCGIGYNHAGKIIEWMEESGYISPFLPKGRKVYITREQFIENYGPPENWL